MKTLLKPGIYAIMNVFYENRNTPLHLREISRRAKLNECSATRYLNMLLKKKIVLAQKEGNMKKFRLKESQKAAIFPLFDDDRLESLPLLRKNAIKEYISSLKVKPVFIIVFGSTAKGTFKETSDVDILEIYPAKNDNKEALKYAEAQTCISISTFRMDYDSFLREIKLKEDYVVQSALGTGFPVFNQKFYYEVMSSERV